MGLPREVIDFLDRLRRRWRWREVTLAEGVVWRQLTSQHLYGGGQTVNVVRFVPTRAGLRYQPMAHPGCAPVAQMAGDTGALAAMNGGFFSPRCGSLDLLRVDGALLATNAVRDPMRVMGWEGGQVPRFRWVAAGSDWPAVEFAMGGHPGLVEGGVVAPRPEEAGGFYQARHPRSMLGQTADGQVLWVTVDGRTAAGEGLSVPDAARLMADLGAVEAINLDGGGSTTLYVHDCSINGVVNHPSDNGVADPWGARAVSDGLYLWAP